MAKVATCVLTNGLESSHWSIFYVQSDLALTEEAIHGCLKDMTFHSSIRVKRSRITSRYGGYVYRFSITYPGSRNADQEILDSIQELEGRVQAALDIKQALACLEDEEEQC